MNFWHIYLLPTDYFNHGIVLSTQIKFFTAIWLQCFKRLRGKPSRALRRLLTAFRYEVKGVFHVDGIFADGKDQKKKISAKQDYQDSDLGMQQSKCCALPLGDSPKLRERDHLLPDYFRETTYLYLKNFHACARYFEKLGVVERIIPFFVSHTQAAYTLDALISLPHIQCQHNTGYSAITMAL